ncbi:MAG: hypothetical protein PHE24_06645 [Patescibacteria group bacterium]|nr:hypothetical protein [Patescibacteria group bacterium]
MNSIELLSELQKLDIPSSWFLIGDTGITDNKTVIRMKDNQWVVYYSQRGGQYDLKVFETEDAACNDLLLRMKSKKVDVKSGA